MNGEWIDTNNSYPNPELCGAGVAFKLAWAVAQKLCNAQRVNETYKKLLVEFTALAALGTVAESIDGIFTGRLVGEILHGPGKAHAVRSLAIREGLIPPPS